MLVRMFGADVILTAAGLGIKGCLKAYHELIDSDPTKYFGANQCAAATTTTTTRGIRWRPTRLARLSRPCPFSPPFALLVQV